MHTNSYQRPEFEKKNFHCPYCNANSQQDWEYLDLGLCSSQCNTCQEYSYWLEKGRKMIYPKILLTPVAHEDMPKSVKKIYEEARLISSDSPRAAAALLRVALEKLTEELGEKKGNLNTRIGNLVKKGLSKNVQQALDTVRITANEGGSHSGQIDLTGKDGKKVVNQLFWLINFIVERMITEPREIEKNFDNLPNNKKEGVIHRDSKNKNEKQE